MNNPLRVLVVFIHGFRGTDTTFKEFPEQVKTSLLNLLPEAHVNIAVYPQFETRGSLTLAVENFCTWLKGIESHRRSQAGGESPLLTVLIGHSMGGLLAGDVYLKFLQEQKSETNPTDSSSVNEFPHILGVLAFDSPFYGISKHSISRSAYSRVSSFSSQFSNAAATLGAGRAVASRFISPAKPTFKALALGGLAVATAAAAGAYIYREQIPTLYSYAVEHFEFVNALSNEEELNERARNLLENPNIMFWCFYLEITKNNEVSHFINLPGENGTSTLGSEFFIPVKYQCQDEIEGHMNMFDASINTSYFIMAQKAVSSIHDAIRQFQAQSP